VQVAAVGLIKAVDRYEPGRGHGFVKYAVPTMLGELKRHFRDKGWSVHVPRATQELVLKVSEALGTLPAKLGRSPRPRDVAKAVGAPLEDVLEAMEAATAYEATSLDAPRPGDDNDDGWSWGDSVAVEEHGYDLVEIGETLRGTLEALPERERMILKLRFEFDMTQAEIAMRVGVSQMHVSRLLRRSLDRLAAASEVFAEAA
jgi:RNA polymerase sigma-B factor